MRKRKIVSLVVLCFVCFVLSLIGSWKIGASKMRKHLEFLYAPETGQVIEYREGKKITDPQIEFLFLERLVGKWKNEKTGEIIEQRSDGKLIINPPSE